MKILYFAQLREVLSCREETIGALPAEVTTVAALRAYLAARGPAWAPLRTLPNIRAAVNQHMANDHTPVQAEDEVAFFPPVTGG